MARQGVALFLRGPEDALVVSESGGLLRLVGGSLEFLDLSPDICWAGGQVKTSNKVLPSFLLGLPERCGEVLGGVLEVLLCSQKAWVEAKLFSAESWAPFSLGEDDLPDLLLSPPFDFPQLDALVCHSLSSRLLCIGSWCKNSSIVSCTSEGLGDAGDCVSDVVADEIEFLRFLAQALD